MIGHNFTKSTSSTPKKTLETVDLYFWNLLHRSTTALSRRSLIKHKVSISDGLIFFLFMANSSFTKLNKAFDTLKSSSPCTKLSYHSERSEFSFLNFAFFSLSLNFTNSLHLMKVSLTFYNHLLCLEVERNQALNLLVC